MVFFLALLSHESALLFGALAALVDGAVGRWPLAASKETHHVTRTTDLLTAFVRYTLRSPWFAFLMMGVGYFILYQFLPISRAPQAADVSAGSLGVRGLYVLQAAAYPFAWFASLLPQNWGLGVVVLAAAATLLLTLFALRTPAYRLPLLLGWGWWGLAILVIAIPLPTDYLIHGPRLLYLSSVGLAITWAVMLDAISRAKPAASRQPLAAMLLPLICLLFIFLTNWQFVRARLADYGRLTSGVHVVAEAMDNEPATAGITLINLPQWLARPRTTYPIGAELEQMLGDYLFAEELMAHNLGVDHPTLAVAMPELLQTTPYSYHVHNQHPLTHLSELPATQTEHVFLTRYLEDGPVMSHLGWLQMDDAAATPVASFTMYDLLSGTAQLCGDEVQVKLIWRGRETISPTTSIFVQLLNPLGQLIAQADGPPLSLPPDLMPWRGRELVDWRSMPLPTDQEPAQVLIGVYDYITNERWQGVDATARPLADNAFVIPVTPCPSD